MSKAQPFKLSGIALPRDALGMLDEIREHFVEHCSVERSAWYRQKASGAPPAVTSVPGRRPYRRNCSAIKVLAQGCLAR